MEAFKVLLRAQIKNKKSSYIGVLILTIIIGLMLAFSISLTININSAAKDAIKSSKFGNLYLNFNYYHFPKEEELKNLKEMKEFENVRILRKIQVFGSVAKIVDDNGKKVEIAQIPALYVYDKDKLPLRIFNREKNAYLKENELLPPKEGEIYVPVSFIEMYNACIGDKYIIGSEESSFEYVISGFVEDISQINMIYIGEHNIYLNQKDYDILENKSNEEKDNVRKLSNKIKDLSLLLKTNGLKFSDILDADEVTISNVFENSNIESNDNINIKEKIEKLKEIQKYVDLDKIEDFKKLEETLISNLLKFNFNYTIHLDIKDEYSKTNTNELFKRIEESTGLRDKAVIYGDDELFINFSSLISYMVLLVVVVFVIIIFIASLAIIRF